MKIILEGIIETLKTRQDGSVTVAFSTQELDSSKGGELFQLRGKYCKALFSDTNITALEEDLVDKTQIAKTGKNKSKAQRLRAVLYRCWEQSGLSIEFDAYYDSEMERLIEIKKSTLE